MTGSEGWLWHLLMKRKPLVNTENNLRDWRLRSGAQSDDGFISGIQ